MKLRDVAYRFGRFWKYGDLPPAMNVVVLHQDGMAYAEDKGLVAGEFVFEDLPLTEPGMPAGQIRPGGHAFFWLRMECTADLVARGELPKILRICISNEQRACWPSRFRALVSWLRRKEKAA